MKDRFAQSPPGTGQERADRRTLDPGRLGELPIGEPLLPEKEQGAIPDVEFLEGRLHTGDPGIPAEGLEQVEGPGWGGGGGGWPFAPPDRHTPRRSPQRDPPGLHGTCTPAAAFLRPAAFPEPEGGHPVEPRPQGCRVSPWLPVQVADEGLLGRILGQAGIRGDPLTIADKARIHIVKESIKVHGDSVGDRAGQGTGAALGIPGQKGKTRGARARVMKKTRIVSGRPSFR